ncbi:MAG TPA: hypothetical protein VMJ12_18575 [Candidatus Acidoferrales bacterium]|nr:hypothetical protein [Candidatus Acidoferrales bacterium]
MLPDGQTSPEQFAALCEMTGARRPHLAEWNCDSPKKHAGFSVMPEPGLFLLFVPPVNRAGIRCVVNGSVAAIFYGESRLTHDVDFVVFLNADDIRRPADNFSEKISNFGHRRPLCENRA